VVKSQTSVSAGQVKVLMSFEQPKPDANPFLSSLVSSLSGRVDVSFFSWPLALWGSYDVLHLHWPEQLVRGQSKRQTLVAFVLCMGLIARLRFLGTPVIWTVHNLRPHQWRNRLEKFAVRALTKSARLKLYLNESTQNDRQGVTILHGDYKEWLSANRSDSRQVTNQVLYFGLVRPYKGVEDLIGAFVDLGAPEWRLVVAGRPTDAGISASVVAASELVDNVQLDLRHVSDEDLVAYLGAAKLVVLPYRTMYNSGSLLLALSSSTHVLAPRTPATESLQAEVGVEWLTLFDSPLTSSALKDGMTRAAATSGRDAPNLEQRGWDDVGELHAELYKLVALQARLSRSHWPDNVRFEIAKDIRFLRHSNRNKSR
jgi:beta-1,4-mannosyltransferase